ncbi:zinc dependent phospholipase C family protein [Bdellovibrio sp. HCB290]|uniref:zinc dependent phospholipase C family protein n=1 Tax=Bdellovibrio sp. HCB290 TaxID=3394356 RepID=UPI0039B4752E
MPAGFTHLAFARKSLDHLESESGKNAKDILDADIGLYLFGCVSPDIPYMGRFDGNPFTNNKEVADDLHYRKTNEVPLLGLKAAKEAVKAGNEELAEALFSFYIGYTSHLIADGIVHPFIRDMVGDYEVAETEHRILEMKLDVLISKRLVGVEVNGVNLQKDLDYVNDSVQLSQVFQSFSTVIEQVHGHKLKPGKIEDLLKAMKTALDIAEGEFPSWYQLLGKHFGAAYLDEKKVVGEEATLVNLTFPIDAAEKGNLQNFMKANKVNFFEHVMPRFFSTFPGLIEKAYDYVFNNGPEVTDLIPAINLDTGRSLANQDLNNKPVLWEQA